MDWRIVNNTMKILEEKGFLVRLQKTL